MINASTQTLKELLGSTYIPNDELEVVSINDALTDVILDELAEKTHNFARITYEDWQNFWPKEAEDADTLDNANPDIKEARTYLRALRPKGKIFKRQLQELKKQRPEVETQDVLRVYSLETAEYDITMWLSIGHPKGGLIHMISSFKDTKEGYCHTTHVPQYIKQFPGTKSLAELLEVIDYLMTLPGYFAPDKDDKIALYVPVCAEKRFSKHRVIMPGRYKFVFSQEGFMITMLRKDEKKKKE